MTDMGGLLHFSFITTAKFYTKCRCGMRVLQRCMT
jgi:hypothetical protein